MSCTSPDCSYIHNSIVLPPALEANPDISGTGVLVGFLGTAYTAFIFLVLRYLIGESKDTHLDESTNPVDHHLLSFIWRTFGKPPARWGDPLKDAVLSMSDTQIVTGLSILASGFSQINCGLSILHWHMVVFLAWFSSVTHLTTLTFLRRYIHDNRGIRTLRLLLMMLLVVTLAVALVPTGGSCGLQTAADFYRLYNGTTQTWSDPPVFPGSPAKCCFLEMSDPSIFLGPDSNYWLSMGSSEVVLIISSFTRALKLFRGSSNFFKQWLRHKPARLCKHIARNFEARYLNSTSRLGRQICFICHSGIMVFIVFMRAIYDLTDSMLWEISWLSFSLAWGTMRILNVRNLAGMDSAAVEGSQETDAVEVEENYWGFGQFVPALLLILPLLSLTEAVLVSSKPKSKDTSSASSVNEVPSSDDTTVDVDEEPVSNISSSTEQPSRHFSPNTDSHAEEDIRDTSIEMPTRTGTDLVNMENQIGSATETAPGTTRRRQSDQSARRHQPAPQAHSVNTLWPAEELYKHNFYADQWYTDLIVCIYFFVLDLGIELIVFTAGAGTQTISAFLSNFTSWRLYVSIALLFLYFLNSMASGRHQKETSDRFLSRLSPFARRIVEAVARRATLLLILFLNLPISMFGTIS